MEQETHSQQVARIITNFSIDSIIGNIIGQQRPQITHTSSSTTTGDSRQPAQAIDLSRPTALQDSTTSFEEDIVDVVALDQQQHWFNRRIPDPHTYGQLSNSPVEKHSSGIGNEQQRTETRKLRAKKYQCPYCWVALSNTGQFRGHIRIHTGERPFKCDQASCQKTFTRNEELTRHKRIHTGQRPYACHLCNKRFGRKDHLKKHTRTHEKSPSKHQQQQHLMNGSSAVASVGSREIGPADGGNNLQVDHQQSLKSFFISDVPLLYFNCPPPPTNCTN